MTTVFCFKLVSIILLHITCFIYADALSYWIVCFQESSPKFRLFMSANIIDSTHILYLVMSYITYNLPLKSSFIRCWSNKRFDCKFKYQISICNAITSKRWVLHIHDRHVNKSKPHVWRASNLINWFFERHIHRCAMYLYWILSWKRTISYVTPLLL